MKPRILSTARLSLPLATAIAALLTAQSASAASLYWDIDGATAGAGSATPSDTWASSSTFWSTSPDGTLATSALTTALTDDLFFSAGINATGNTVITVNTAENARSLTVQDGAVLIGGTGSVTLGGTGIINVANNLAASPLSATIGDTGPLTIDGTAGLTKTGVGTLVLNGSTGNPFTGGLNVNGGTLDLRSANLAIPTDLVNSGNALSLGGGRLLITGKSTDTTNQTLGNVTVNSGGGSIVGDKNGGTALNITLGTLTSTASGGSLLVGAGGTNANLPVITTTTDIDATGIYGGRSVYFDGTANTGYDWAANAGGGGPVYTLSAYAGYAALDLTAGTDSVNSRITASQLMSGSRSTNSLKFENPLTAQILDLAAGNTLTLANGGLLFTGAGVAQGPRINNGSITAGNGSGSYDLVVHQFNASSAIAIGTIGSGINNNASINSSIVDNGPNPVTLVKNGPGGLVVGGAANAFTGGIVINQGNVAFNTATAINNNPITFNSSSFVHTFGGSTTSGNITLNNGSQVTILNNNSSFTVTGNVTGSGGMSAANGGQGAITLNLNGTANNFTGPIRFTANNGTQAATINVASLVDTDTFQSGNITFGAGSAIPTGNNFGLSGNAVAVTLDNRHFQMASDLVLHSINNASASAFTINSGLIVTGTRAKNLQLGGAGTGLSTFAGVIGNAASPTAAGSVPIAVRTTAVVNAGSPITLASVEGIVAGATISGTGIAAGTTIATVNPFTRQVTLSAATTGAMGITTVFTIPGAVNSVSVTKAGTGTWVVSGDNTYTGPTNITAGVLNIQNVNALGVTGVGTQVANAATLSLQGGFSYAAEPLTLIPGGGGSAMLLNVSGGNTWNGSITSNTATGTNVSRIQSDADTMTLAGVVTVSGSAHQFVLQGNGAITATGQITGVGRVTSGASGTGIRTVSNDTNNFTGATSVNGGVLAFTSIGNVGATSSSLGAPVLADATIQLAAVLANPGTLRYVGTAPGGHTSDRVINLLSPTGPNTIEASGTGPLVLTATNTATGAGIKTLTLSGTNTGDNSIGAIVDNSATNTTAVTKDGAGTWILTGANTYAGNTTVNTGTLELADNAQLKFVLGATSGVNNSISGAGTVTLEGDFVIDTSAANALSSGTWTLENVDTLTGAYGSNFTVAGFTDAGGDKWTKANGATIYTFDEATGVLTLAASADPFPAWATLKGLTGGNNAKTDDPDGDGFTNLDEFAFDGNPLSGANDGKIVGKIATVGGDQVMTLTLPVRSGATFANDGGDQLSALIDGIYYRVEGSLDLGTFANVITEVTGGDAATIQTGLPGLSAVDWTYRTFRAPGTVPTVSKTFLRAKISETP